MLKMPVSNLIGSRALTCARGESLMALYDVFPNPSHRASGGIPYVVVIQSALLDALPTRLTIVGTGAEGGRGYRRWSRLRGGAAQADHLDPVIFRRPIDLHPLLRQ